jgi:hypothetical protein
MRSLQSCKRTCESGEQLQAWIFESKLLGRGRTDASISRV